MPIYENYFKRSLRSYTVSPLDSMWYIEYIRSNRSGYDVLSPTAVQLKTLSSIHIRLKVELKDTFEK